MHAPADDAPAPAVRLVALIAAVVVAGAAAVLAVASVPPLDPAPSLPWWVLAAGFAVAEAGVVHLRLGRHAHSFTLSEVVLVLGIMEARPVEVCLAAAVGPALTMVVHRLSLPKLVFNIGLNTLTAAVGVTVAVALAPDPPAVPGTWLAVTVATVAGSIGSCLLVAAAIGAASGAPFVPTAREALPPAVVVTLTNTGLGLALATMLHEEPATLALLVPAAGLLFGGYRAYANQRKQDEALAFLHETVLHLSGDADLDRGTRHLLERARQAFAAEVAELVLLPGRAGADGVHLRLGPDGVVDEVDFDRAAVGGLVGVTGAGGGCALIDHRSGLLSAHLAELGVDRAMLADLRVDNRVLGVLLVGQTDRIASFDRADLRLLHSLAGHAATVLQLDRLGTAYRELRDLRDQLQFQATHDQLTGLANRAALLERLEQGAAEGASCALAYLDLDDFKPVNDLYGHGAGDELLRRVAGRLRDAVRPGDLVARVGGDEFVVLLAGRPDEYAAHQLATRIEAFVGAPFRLDGVDSDVQVGASVGLVVVDLGRQGADGALRDADAAMYVRKAQRTRQRRRRERATER